MRAAQSGTRAHEAKPRAPVIIWQVEITELSQALALAEREKDRARVAAQQKRDVSEADEEVERARRKTEEARTSGAGLSVEQLQQEKR